MSRSRLIFIIFYLTIVLIGTVHLRVSESRIYYRSRRALVVGDDLKRQLGKKQLRLERLINPAAISESVGRSSPSDPED